MVRSKGARLLILATGADRQSLLDLQGSLAASGHQAITASSGPAALDEIRGAVDRLPDGTRRLTRAVSNTAA